MSQLHWTYISEIERGLKSPTLASVSALADALRVRPHELLKAAEESDPGILHRRLRVGS